MHNYPYSNLFPVLLNRGKVNKPRNMFDIMDMNQKAQEEAKKNQEVKHEAKEEIKVEPVKTDLKEEPNPEETANLKEEPEEPDPPKQTPKPKYKPRAKPLSTTAQKKKLLQILTNKTYKKADEMANEMKDKIDEHGGSKESLETEQKELEEQHKVLSKKIKLLKNSKLFM